MSNFDGVKSKVDPFNNTILFWSKKIKALKIFSSKSLVKIGSVTAEILLIWTNVDNTNVAWKDVSMNLLKRVPGTYF